MWLKTGYLALKFAERFVTELPECSTFLLKMATCSQIWLFSAGNVGAFYVSNLLPLVVATILHSAEKR